MQKRALQLASVASMIEQFNMSNIQILLSLGYLVDVIADFTNPGTITNERAEDLKKQLNSMGVRVFDVAIPRTLNVVAILNSYMIVKRIVEKEHYDLIHCHSPLGGVICRLAAKRERKRGTKVIYTAHGFHFFKGAPLKNWLLFYPIEKHFSRYTDVLITINKEDYARAKKRLHAVDTVYIPGVGVDTQRFANNEVDIQTKRAELNISNDDYVLISVGELNSNKNHEVVLKALSQINDFKMKYLLVGKGPLKDYLRQLARDLKIEERVIFAGYRTDVSELLKISECFVFPSKREGLGLAAIEGMSAGLPVIGHNIGGIRDFVIDGETGLLCVSNEVDEYVTLIQKARNCQWNKEMLLKNAQKFDKTISNQIIEKVYRQF